MSKTRELTPLAIKRFYTTPQKHPFEMVEWETRTASITDPSGKTIFEQKNVEVPKTWSQLATNIVASKYFHGRLGTPQREHSVKQLISRVADTITDWGIKDNYFQTPEDAEAFRAELTYILLTQRAAFNSPVWFNVGTNETTHPQCSACQPYHALINTPKGLIPIGEIVEKQLIGLQVFDASGITKVVNTKYNGEKEVFRITLNDGHFIEATGDHVVCAHESRRAKKISWKRVDELKIGDYMRVYAKLPVQNTEKSDPRLISEAALAGWLQADGFVGDHFNSSSTSLTIEFMVVNSDEEKWIKEHMENVFSGVHYKERSVESKIEEGLVVATRIRLYGEVLREFVEKYDLLRRGTEIRVPRIIMTAPNDVVIAYLRSVFQSEGYVTSDSSRSRIGLATISRQWMEDILILLSRLGIYGRLRRKKEPRPNRHDLWEIDIALHSERKQFAEIIGFISSGKKTKLSESIQIPGKECPAIRYQRIVKIESLGTMPVFDIQTESGNYLTNSVLVHNCFINSVEDDMQSILDLVKIEGMIFKFGSGSGVNVSKLRAEGEPLSTGGTASGPLSFMKVFDAGAGAIKSGGKTRRAAKMVLMDADHPDILKFIWSKAHEEKKAWALIEAGYEGGINGEAYQSVFFQNANHSVRVTDEFMEKVLQDEDWHTTYRTTGEIATTHKARNILRQIAQATWECGDPGLQFDTTINKWHTCKNSGRINASNPCSEFVFLDNTSCNLASINLMKYRNMDGSFNIEEFLHTVDIIFTAQEIIVSHAGYPTEKFKEMSEKFRPLGLGYTNLGALLMSLGLPYDSEQGRAFAAIITALMHGEAYKQSALLARAKGPFDAFEENKEPMMEVMHMHKNALKNIDVALLPREIVRATFDLWEEVIELGEKYGYRNAQATLLAPTGTISFLLDCDTTGIEPDIALVKYKRLVGGGTLKMVNNTVPLALKTLGYSQEQVKEIVNYINEHDTIEEAPHLKPGHLPVFDCAFKPANGTRYIHYLGHVKMMAAVQPFLSGAISKCVAGDTLIFTERGIIPISSFYRNEAPDTFRPIDLRVASEKSVEKADLFYYGGEQATIKLTLADGREIEGTPNHRIKVATPNGKIEWKRLDQITEDDYIAIKIGANMWAKEDAKISFKPSYRPQGQNKIRIPPTMSPALAKLLGYYIAEGNITKSNWTIRITNNNDVILRKIDRLYAKLFRIRGKIVSDYRNGVKSYIVHSKTLVELFEYLGCQGKAGTKQIPWSVLQSRKETIKAFIEGLWLDGYVRKQSPIVAIGVKSKKLLQQLQIVLNNFSLKPNIIRTYNKQYDRYFYVLTMSGKDIIKFSELFTLDEPHKQEALNQVVAKTKQRNRLIDWADVIPIHKRTLQKIIKEDHNTHKWRSIFDPRTKNLSYYTITKVLQEYEIPELTEIVNNNIHFSKVQKIDVGFTEVFDFQVPATHAFIGNAIINHNTVNVPESATTEDIMQTYIDAWKMGVKCIAIYRDGSKKIQPLSTKKAEKTAQKPSADLETTLIAQSQSHGPIRRRLPDERQSITHKFSIEGHEGYITVGLYDDGTPGEVFITMSKEGSTISGLMDTIATLVSIALQYGIPLNVLVRKFINMRFEPSGFTTNPSIPTTKSIVDYVFRYLGLKFLPEDQREGIIDYEELRRKSDKAQPLVPANGSSPKQETNTEQASSSKEIGKNEAIDDSAPLCSVCGNITVRSGSCYVCMSCGSTTGCS